MRLRTRRRRTESELTRSLCFGEEGGVSLSVEKPRTKEQQVNTLSKHKKQIPCCALLPPFLLVSSHHLGDNTNHIDDRKNNDNKADVLLFALCCCGCCCSCCRC